MSVRRLAGVAAFVVYPLGVVAYWPLRLIGARRAVWARVHGLLVAGLAAVGLVVLVATGWGRRFSAPWRELGSTVRGSAKSFSIAPGDHGPSMIDALRNLISDRWLSWLLGQVPVSLCVALLPVGWTMYRLRRFAPSWRGEDAPTHEDVSAKQRAKVGRQQERAAERRARSADPVAFRDLRMPFGVSAAGEGVSLLGSQFLAHMLLYGPTGAGKTTTMTRVLHGWLVHWKGHRLPAVVFDFKADTDVAAALRGMCAATGRRLHLVQLDGDTATYNALRYGTSEMVVDRIVEMMAATDGFESVHYRGLGHRWLLGCMAALDNLIEQGKSWDAPGGRRKWQRDLPDLAELVSLAGLRKRADQLSGHVAVRVGDQLAEFDPDPKRTSQAMRDVAGMVNRIKLLVDTGTGQLLTEHDDGIDLEAIIRAGDVVLFSLAAAGNSLAAKTVGNLAIADLTSTFARLQNEQWSKKSGKRSMVMLDEFGALGGQLLDDLYQRARSAGGTLVLSVNSDANLDGIDPDFGKTVRTNSNVQIFHQLYGEDAETHANAMGTTQGWKETVQVQEDAGIYGSEHLGSGVGSLREARGYAIHPDELKSLQPGQVVLFSRSPRVLERVTVTSAPALPSPAAAKPGHPNGETTTERITHTSTPGANGAATVSTHRERVVQAPERATRVLEPETNDQERCTMVEDDVIEDTSSFDGWDELEIVSDPDHA